MRAKRLTTADLNKYRDMRVIARPALNLPRAFEKRTRAMEKITNSNEQWKEELSPEK